ncbi:hypothetical protein TRIUR3_23616 [Triticum urartu]|uniref:Uncharacterized protein n=2 Tax=Triticum TaxID=4564 RepID=A0A9R0ZE46_TRITD|nr:hypothetical protein TRIUR3_23616 [Triticum urartu]VAI76239.1 unnamed protein product [Triticum turgidum subsp. durum]
MSAAAMCLTRVREASHERPNRSLPRGDGIGIRGPNQWASKPGGGFGMASPRNDGGFLTQEQREKLRIAVQNAETLSLTSPRSPTGTTTSALLQQYDWGEARATVAFREGRQA